jgi:hypothetical protein
MLEHPDSGLMFDILPLKLFQIVSGCNLCSPYNSDMSSHAFMRLDVSQVKIFIIEHALNSIEIMHLSD